MTNISDYKKYGNYLRNQFGGLPNDQNKIRLDRLGMKWISELSAVFQN